MTTEAEMAVSDEADTDADVLRDAGETAVEIDVRYRMEEDVNERQKLRRPRDAAFSAYSEARLRLMRKGTITTAQHVEDMRAIRSEIDQAADSQALIVAIGRFVAFLATV